MGLTKPRAAQIFNLDYKQSTRVVTTVSVSLTGGAPSSVDGVSLSVGDRVLVTAQSTGSQNGLYLVTTVGSGSNGTWARTSDGNENGEIEAGMIVMVTEGAIYADTQWKLITDDPITIGTTALTFTQNYMANSISGGTSNVVVNSNANVTISSAGTANVLLVSSTGTVTTGTASVTGNITGGNIRTTGQANIGTLEVTGVATLNGNTTINGHVLPLVDIAYDLGSPSQRWRSIYVSANTIDIGGATISANLTTGSLILTGPDGAEFILSGTSLTNSIGSFGFVEIGSNTNSTSTTSGALQVAGGAGITGNIYVGGLANIAGNVNGGNIYTAGNITAANIGSNALVSAATLSVTGNANVGNLGGTSAVFASLTGTLTTAAQPNVTSVGNLVSLTVTGNANAGNISGTRAVFTNIVGTLETAAQPNVTSLGTLISLAVSGNVSSSNLIAGAQVVATGNITGSNVVTAGQVLATGNVVGSTLIASGNIVVQSRQQVKFYDTDSSNFISLRAPNALTGDYLLTLPTSYGNADQVLSTNGAGILAWADQTGGGGGSSATSYPNSTVSPVPGSIGNFDLSFNFVQTSQETPFESSATDAFGVNLGEVYSMMDPGGEVLEPVDFGVLT